MGRPRKTNTDLPPRMRLHHGAYWYVAGSPQTWTRLGKDRAAALLEWARLEGAAAPAAVATVSAAITRYRRDLLPKLARRLAITSSWCATVASAERNWCVRIPSMRISAA